MSDGRSGDAAVRARRLRVALTLFGTVIEDPRAAMDASNTLTEEGRPMFEPDDIYAFRAGDQVDLDLANACLSIERNLRDAEWAALERVLAAIPPGATYKAILDLAGPRPSAAFEDLRQVGWVRPWHEYDDPPEA